MIDTIDANGLPARAGARAARRWCVASLFAACALGAAPARADLIYELNPLIGGGATNNVQVSDNGQEHLSDGFTQVGGSLRARYLRARAVHTLGYRLSMTHYLIGRGQDLTSHELAWLSSFTPSATLTLRLTANSTLSRTSGLGAPDPATAVPQAALTGSTLFLAVGATEDLSYEANPRRTYGQTLSFFQFYPLDVSAAQPDVGTTTLVTGAFRGSRLMGRDTLTLNVYVSDSITKTDPALRNSPFSGGQTFVGQGLLGWTHELSPTWSTTLQAGPAVIVRLSGDGVIAPAAVATLNYTRIPWFASLSVAQTPTLNFYLGETTLSDQAIVRVALPLTRSELVYFGGFGGYAYARIADNQGSLTRAYDQFIGGASLIARLRQLPVSGVLSYTVISQRGNVLAGRSVPDLGRQAVMLNIVGTFAWGPGTPPLFGGLI
jgi:hypothetical protein